MAMFLTTASRQDPAQTAIPAHVRRAVLQLESLHEQGGPAEQQLVRIDEIQRSFSQDSGLPSAIHSPSARFPLLARFAARIGIVALAVSAVAAFAQVAGIPAAAGAAAEYVTETTFTAGLAGMTTAHMMRQRQQQAIKARFRSEEVVNNELALETVQLRQIKANGEVASGSNYTISTPYKTLAHVVTHRMSHPHR